MFYDLNVPWTSNDAELQRRIAFLAELGYNVLALSHTFSGKVPSKLECPIPTTLSFALPPNVQVFRRTNLVLTDATQNHRLTELNSISDLFALRPTDEKTFAACCNSLDCDIISLDLSQRFYFPFKHKALSNAVARGIRIELCYSPGLSGDSSARRNLIQNATSIIRSTRGRGIVISSEASESLGLRGPADVVNLASVWGLGQERGREALGREARAVVVAAKMRRTSYRGAIDIVYGGEQPEEKNQEAKGKEKWGEKDKDKQQQNGSKRKSEEESPRAEQQLSKRAKKKAAHERAAAVRKTPAQMRKDKSEIRTG